MACAARSLTSSARALVQRGPRLVSTRSFSNSPFRYARDNAADAEGDLKAADYPPLPKWSPDLLSKEERSMYDLMSAEDRAAFDAETQQFVDDYNDLDKRREAFAQLDRMVNEIEKETPIRIEERLRNKGFWAEDEEDEFGQVEDGDEEINDDEITSMAHAQMELHREMREYARITAWDMPMLSKMAKPFTLPPETHILRFRYTTYMGEQHPAEPKVVVELASQDLTPKYLTEAQRQTFLKLVGTRYNPQTDIVRMSCEQFGSRAQNKRYLADIVNTLIKEAKEGDSFADVPLDTRHHKPKIRHQFPESWKMTEQRRQQLAARRAERLAAQENRASIVDGNKVVAHAVEVLPELNPELQAQAAAERERVAVKMGARPGKKPLRR